MSMEEEAYTTTHIARMMDLGELRIPDPDFGDLKLQVFPFIHDGKTAITLPKPFADWEESLREIMRRIPVQANATQCFVTIDSKFFATPGFLRREGIHMDGNFCVDPGFRLNSWGGSPGWAGLRYAGGAESPDNSHVSAGFVLPYKITIPIGQYVSGELGGTIVVSTQFGCRAWPGVYVGDVGDGGSWENMEGQIQGEGMRIEANRLYLLSSNCPHETIEVDQGVRRTFLRVTLPHNYENSRIFDAPL